MSASAAIVDPARTELRRRLQDAEERVMVLEKRRAGLADVVARAAAEEQALARELEIAERELAGLDAERGRDQQRAEELELEIARAEQDRVELLAQLETGQRSLDRLALHIRGLERQLAATLQRIGLARKNLADVVQTVVRLSYHVERESEGRQPLA